MREVSCTILSACPRSSRVPRRPLLCVCRCRVGIGTPARSMSDGLPRGEFSPHTNPELTGSKYSSALKRLCTGRVRLLSLFPGIRCRCRQKLGQPQDLLFFHPCTTSAQCAVFGNFCCERQSIKIKFKQLSY